MIKIELVMDELAHQLDIYAFVAKMRYSDTRQRLAYWEAIKEFFKGVVKALNISPGWADLKILECETRYNLIP